MFQRFLLNILKKERGYGIILSYSEISEYDEEENNEKTKENKGITLVMLVVTIGSSISVYATYNYFASDVKYKKEDGTEISVENALNDLYEKYSIRAPITLHLKTLTHSTALATSNYNSNNHDYKYFKIQNIEKNSFIKTAQLRACNKATNTNVTLAENTEYLLSDYNYGFWVNITSSSSNTSDVAIYSYDLYLYN